MLLQKVYRILKDGLNFSFLSEDRGHSFSDICVFEDNRRGKKKREGEEECQDIFVLFLNPRPQFRVKEHSDSVVPPLSSSAKHKNQDLHTYMALIPDLGVTGCQYSKESLANQPFHPSPSSEWRRCLSENLGALSRLELRARSEAVQAAFSRGKAAPPFPEGRQRPLGREHSSPPVGHPGVSNSSPRELESWMRRKFPTGCSTPVPLPDTCVPRTSTVVTQSTICARSPPGHPRTHTAGRRVSFLNGLWLSRQFYVFFPPRYNHLCPSLSAPGTEKPARRTDAQG